MICEQFNKWLEQVGPVEAARLISEYEESRNRDGVRYQSVQGWVKGVPPTRIIAVEAVAGISRHVINPVLYPDVA